MSFHRTCVALALLLSCLSACDYPELTPLARLPSDELDRSNWVYRGHRASAAEDGAVRNARVAAFHATTESAPVPAATTQTLLSPTPSEAGHDVELYSSRAPHTRAVALLAVRARADEGSSALAELRGRAASAGAEAVTDITLHADADDGRIAISGIGVTFEDATGAKPFDVVGTIDVDAAAGHEADACAELRRRTRDLDADMVTDLSYEAGDSVTPLHLRATAIRFRTRR